MALSLAFGNAKYSDRDLNRSLQSILESNELLAMATVRDGSAYVNTAYYCYNSSLDVYILAEPTTVHCQNLTTNASVAFAVYDSRQPWTKDKRGLQLFGKCEMAKGIHLAEAVKLYLSRFVGLKQWVTSPDDIIRGAINSKFYVAKINRVKLFDEVNFGKEEFIELSIRGSE